MGCTASIRNDTQEFANCSDINIDHLHHIALVRGSVGIFCSVLCLATFLFELVYICCKKNSTTLQRLFVYLTFSSLLYSAALAFHIEHYFQYSNEQVQCYICRAIGFFDQYTGCVQLLLTLGITLKLFHKVFFPFQQRRLGKGCLSRHHFKIEVAFVVASFVLPCFVIWVPFLIDGPGGYGPDGPWCWIQVLEDGCNDNMRGLMTQLFLWYIPYVVVSFISLLCIVAIIVFLLYYYNKSKSSKLMVIVMDMLLLSPFLVVFCCVCIIEVTIEIILLQQPPLHINNYSMWLVYAVVTPISGAIIPIAFFFYFLRKKRLNAPHKLQDISRARATVHDSDRVSANSHTSQQERPNYLSCSAVEWETSQDSAVIIPHSLGTNYGSIDSRFKDIRPKVS